MFSLRLYCPPTQSDKHRWRNSFLLGIGMTIFLGAVILGIFVWLPSIDEIKQRRIDYANLQQYGFDISNCGSQKCVKVDKNKCNYGEKANYCVAIVE